MTRMRHEPVSRDRRRRFADAFDCNALALLPGAQHALLREWLRSSAQTRRWDALLKIAGPTRIELMESLAQALAVCGAATLEEKLERGTWRPTSLQWRDYEALCVALGITTQAAQRTAFLSAWESAGKIDWRQASLEEAHQALRDASMDKAQARLALLIRLNDWLAEGNSGSRREFALFARGHTKQISQAEWEWLATIVELAECGIERHASALWLAGDLQLKIDGRTLDIGAAGDFLGITPLSFDKLGGGNTGATHYRLVENRTSFENLARAGTTASQEIVLWLPGYAPTWWRTAVGRLLDAVPAPARISCDADPDGVQIALNAAELWSARGLAWEPCAMHAEDAARAQHVLPLTERDLKLAASLLNHPGLPPALEALLQWCIAHRSKAEQENWL